MASSFLLLDICKKFKEFWSLASPEIPLATSVMLDFKQTIFMHLFSTVRLDNW